MAVLPNGFGMVYEHVIVQCRGQFTFLTALLRHVLLKEVTKGVVLEASRGGDEVSSASMYLSTLRGPELIT